MWRGLTAGGLLWLLLMASPALAADQSVTISYYTFSQTTIHVDPGDKVTWTWAGPDTNHSVTAADFDSDPGVPFPNHSVGDLFSHTYPTAGSFHFQCKVHVSMQGTVIVGGDSTPPPSPPSP